MKPTYKTYSDGTKAWYLNGQRHREDGPASEYTDGSKGWWLNDKKYTEDEYYQEMKLRCIKLWLK